MPRCWRCGATVPSDQVRRRNVVTGETTTHGARSVSRRYHRRRVDLCGPCDVAFAEEEHVGRMKELACSGVLIILLLIAAAAVALNWDRIAEAFEALRVQP